MGLGTTLWVGTLSAAFCFIDADMMFCFRQELVEFLKGR